MRFNSLFQISALFLTALSFSSSLMASEAPDEPAIKHDQMPAHRMPSAEDLQAARERFKELQARAMKEDEDAQKWVNQAIYGSLDQEEGSE